MTVQRDMLPRAGSEGAPRPFDPDPTRAELFEAAVFGRSEEEKIALADRLEALTERPFACSDPT